MSFFAELRERRIFQVVAAFAAAGWICLEVLNSLIERGIVPEFLYEIAFVWYLGGLLGSCVVGWYHGEKGRQDIPRTEAAFLSGIGLVALFLTGTSVRDHLYANSVAGLDDGFDLRRVAVTYFQDGSSDGETAYLADALTEGLIERLATVQSLDVVSRNGVLPFRGSQAPFDSIGRYLRAGTLVAGSVEPRGDRLRVSFRLVDGASGADLGARSSFETDLNADPDAVGALAEEVANLFRQRLGEEVRLRTVFADTDDPRAWRLVQQGEAARKEAERRLDAYEHGAPAEFARADSLFALAGELVPGWAEAPLMRGRIALVRAQTVHDAGERARLIDEGLAHAASALAIAPTNAGALEVRGTLHYLRFLYRIPHEPAELRAALRRAEESLVRATELDRNLASAHATLSHLYYQPSVSDVAQAALRAQQAYEADAYLRNADDVVFRLFITNLDMGQFAQAERWCTVGVQRFPENRDFALCRLRMMTAPGAEPDVDSAWSVRDRYAELTPEEAREMESLRGDFLVAGALARAAEAAAAVPDREAQLADSARAVLRRAHDAFTALGDPHQRLLTEEAFAWVILGDLDRAIDLWKVYAAASHGFQQDGDISWRWQPLRSHPRFNEIVTQEAARH